MHFTTPRSIGTSSYAYCETVFLPILSIIVLESQVKHGIISVERHANLRHQLFRYRSILFVL